MKKIVLGVAAVLGATAFATPAHAVRLKWNVDYIGFFADGASINGSFVADESAAVDGLVSGDEFESWIWSWSGNSDVDAFSVSSSSGDFATLFGNPGFFVDGRANQVNLTDGQDQGFYSSDNFGLDLEFLFVDNFSAGTFLASDLAAAGTISVSDPEVVPEPAMLLGLMTLAGAAAVTKRQKQKTA